MIKWFAVMLSVIVMTGQAVPAQADLLSPDDRRLYQRAFQAAHQDDFPTAHTLAAQARDPALAAVLQWMDYSQAESQASFSDITAFVRAHPAWPQGTVLIRHAEEAITPSTPEQALRDWFSANSPLTAEGVLAYGKLLMTAGQVEKATPLLRSAWINDSFSADQEQEFLASFSSVLRDEDQIARLDHLLWERQGNARAQLARVNLSYQSLGKARLALASNASNAEALASAVPEPLRSDPGLIYDLEHYYRTHDQDDQAIALLNHPLRNKSHADLWWNERLILARRQLFQGQAAEAYTIARDHGLSDGLGYAECEWLAGWISLRFLNDPEKASGHFTHMFERGRHATKPFTCGLLGWACRRCPGTE